MSILNNYKDDLRQQHSGNHCFNEVEVCYVRQLGNFVGEPDNSLFNSEIKIM